jgi:CelD/BcsL family acetyltransferase involved in cellulose biosynthesis
MNIRRQSFDQLTAEEIAAWSAMQSANPQLASPFFRPEFTQAVAAVRNGVEVAVLEEGGRPIGFFPYERTRGRGALPVGSRLSDFHGVIAGSQFEFDPIRLLRCCGLSSWRFDHLESSQSPLARFAYRHADSPFIDLAQGFETYAAGLSTHFRASLRRKRNNLEREFGPVRFEPDVRDRSILSTLFQWKRQQYQKSKVLDVLGIRWVSELLEDILVFRSTEFSAMMPVLYAGDRVVAICYLLRSGRVLHSWFPAYDCQAARCSPGMQLNLEILRAAASLGITRVDLGKGEEEYKSTLRTGAVQVAEGAVDLSSLKASARSAWWAVRNRLHASPLRKVLKYPARKVSHLHGWLALK